MTMGIGVTLLLALMGATVVVLVTGIVLMARGGEANRKYGNKMMVLRVAFQGAAIFILALLLATKK